MRLTAQVERNVARTWAKAAALALLLAAACGVRAHGIVGNRLFPTTATFDDPAVNDELLLQVTGYRPDPDLRERGARWSLSRLLTPTLEASLEGGWLRQSRARLTESGATVRTIALKKEVVRDPVHEELASVFMGVGLAHSGSPDVGMNGPLSLRPGMVWGKGFGDAPQSLAWLRPFGLTAGAELDVPAGHAATNLEFRADTGTLVPGRLPNTTVLRWGFAVQYSPIYHTSRFTPGQLPEREPVDQWVPMLEFGFVTPRTGHTTATALPGLAYVGSSFQLSAQAIAPLNSRSGHGVGASVVWIIFLDDAIPAVFGRPLLAH